MIGLKTHRISPGDSLQKLARLYDIEDWTEIVEINKLDSPYIDSVLHSEEHLNNDKVAKVGDVILIPDIGISTHLPNKGNEEIETLAYGIDLDLYSEKDSGVVFTEVEGGLSIESGDIKLSRGLENLSQQLKIRLSTKKGALLLHPDFGSNLHKYTGKLDKQSDRNKILFEVESCIRGDFRVKGIEDLNIVKEKGRLLVSAKIIPVDPGRPFVLYKYIT